MTVFYVVPMLFPIPWIQLVNATGGLIPENSGKTESFFTNSTLKPALQIYGPPHQLPDLEIPSHSKFLKKIIK